MVQYCKVLFGLVLLFFPNLLFSQKSDTVAKTFNFGGAITVTTKGISTFPNLTLGKPAAIFDLVAGNGRLSFEPTFRFSLEGKPWTFLFWGRYKAVQNDKFLLGVGLHPAFTFKTIHLVDNTGSSREFIRTQRYLAGELAPTWLLSKNVSLGLYYIYSRGLEKKEITKNSNFISLRSSISNIKLSENFFLKFAPQLYYLKMDRNDGFFANATLTITRRTFPFSVSSTINQTIESTIPGEDFLWNINLIYSFGAKYRKL